MGVIKDAASFANFDEVSIYHVDLDLKVDFEKKILDGYAVLRMKCHKSTNKVVLDSRDLSIKSVRLGGNELVFKAGSPGVLGESVTIDIPQAESGKEFDLVVYYSTSPTASALQFVDKELTADKSQPYLYSQCQAIHARSIIPCMDTPAIKQTYNARVHVPKGVTCLMSAIGYGKDNSENAEKVKEWHAGGSYKDGFDHKSFDGYDAFLFKQPQRMPSYLFAIVAGELEKRDISDRCAVWAEPSMVDKARWEFEDTELMLKTAEELLGKYRWGRYDLIVLPPFFPFGGMENPCLTFVTPTIIAGDRSLTNVIAHEIAHSWTGNLVTNANWEHFWLNEGFTVFCERKIMGRIYGEGVRQFENICGWEDRMLTCINDTFNPTHEFTKLCPCLNGIDPDDAFSTIPYEKGSALLLVLEQKLGDSVRFEQFLRDYIDKFAGQSVVTDDWKQFLYAKFSDKKDVLNSINWNGWLTEAGVPPNTPEFNDEALKDCRHLAKVWTDGTEEEVEKLDPKAFQDLTSDMKVKVLDCIETSGKAFTNERFLKLLKKYDLENSGNCEVIFSFSLIALKSKYEPLVPFMLDFVTRQGRLKYVKPIFNKLFKWDEMRDLAIAKFKKNIPYMHPITAQVISKMI
jgi:leukotriene-A4 hydrolase